MVDHHELNSLEDLKPAPYNPRRISESAAEGLGYSLQEFGDLSGVVWNRRTGHLVCGHQRVEQLRKRGAELVDGALQLPSGERFPVRVVDWPEGKEKAGNVTANNTHIAGEFTPNLAPLLQEIKLDVGDDAFVKMALERLTRDAQKMQGFRPGAGFARTQIGDWKDENSFFTMPEWLAPIWEKATHVVVIFSGGKDSTSAALWAAHHGDGKQVVLTFADPGVEFPGMSAHAQSVAQFLGADFEVVKSPLDWWTYLLKEGMWPSLLYRRCAQEFVYKPTTAFAKKLPRESTVLITGTRAEEASRGSTKTERSDLQFANGYQHYAPCFSAKKVVLDGILAASGVPIWEGYARGFARTACWCCPGQCGEQAMALQRNYPGLAEDIRRWEKRIGPMRPNETPTRTFDDLLRAGEKRAERAERKQAEATPAQP